MSSSVYEKVLEIYQEHYICPNCLGRMFSLLGTNTTNIERGSSLLLSIILENHRRYLSKEKVNKSGALYNLKLLAENANYIPAQNVLKKEGISYVVRSFGLEPCVLCRNIFSNLHEYVAKAKEMVQDIEFNNFLIGTTPNPEIINNEDTFKAKLNILEAESFKSHFNRDLGKLLSKEFDRPTEFRNPDILLIFNVGFEEFSIDLIIRSLFIFGRYNKFIRGIPQTHWDCRNCLGKGCTFCNFTGKQYLTSVEELIAPEFIKRSSATSSKFHGAGREDIDVRMLGNGRPFILELNNPKKRSLDLKSIKEHVNEKNERRVKIHNLRLSNKSEVISLKSGAVNTKKVYKAVVSAEKELNVNEFEKKLDELKRAIENQKIRQRTPIRVSHRRADKFREKIIYKIEGKYINPKRFEFSIKSQGGTYIKELITGDDLRTTPSFAEVFEISLKCEELDVMKIEL